MAIGSQPLQCRSGEGRGAASTAISEMLDASKAIDLAALALRRASATRLSYRDPRLTLDHRRRRAVVDETFRRDRCANSLLDDRHDLENAGTADERVDAIPDLHLCRRLRRSTVHSHMAATAGGRRLRSTLVDPDSPEPDVYPRLFD